MWLTEAVAPSKEPITLAVTKLHLRVDSDITADDTLITTLIKAARRRVEAITGRQLMLATWTLRLDAWCPVLVVPKPPLSSVVSLSYVDEAGDTQVLSAADYQLERPTGALAGPARLQPAYQQTWPPARGQWGAITLQFQAGYGDTEDGSVPEDLRHAMLLLIAHWYENRETVVTGTIATELPAGARHLMKPYCVRGLEVAA